jgi:hypothetical protein
VHRLCILWRDEFPDRFGDFRKSLVPCSGVDVHRQSRVAMTHQRLCFFRIGAGLQHEGIVGNAGRMEVNLAAWRPLLNLGSVKILIQITCSVKHPSARSRMIRCCTSVVTMMHHDCTGSPSWFAHKPGWPKQFSTINGVSDASRTLPKQVSQAFLCDQRSRRQCTDFGEHT